MFSSGGDSRIDNLLARGEGKFSFTDLVDEEEIIDECKCLNTALLDYLTQEGPLQQLIDLVVEEPDASADDKRRFKHPYVASELLMTLIAEAVEITRPLFDDPPLLVARIFKIIQGDKPPSPLLAGYFSKVASALWRKRTPLVFSFVKKQPSIVDNLIRHIGATSVMEFLLRFLNPGMDEAEDERSQIVLPDGFLDWLVENRVLHNILENFRKSKDARVHANTGELLIGILARAIDDAQFAPLVKPISDGESAKQLCDIVANAKSPAALFHSLDILTEYVRQAGPPEGDVFDSEDQLQPIVVRTGHIMKDLAKILKQAPKQAVENNFESLKEPVGMARIKAVELFAVCVEAQFIPLEKDIIKSGALPLILDLVHSYPWNNLLHCQAERLMIGILESQVLTSLKVYLVKKCHLLDKLMKMHSDSESGSKLRLGYMPFITRVSNACVKAKGDEDTEVVKAVEGNKKWDAFCEAYLNGQNKVETQELGGPKPKTEDDESSSDEEGGEEYDQNLLAKRFGDKADEVDMGKTAAPSTDSSKEGQAIRKLQAAVRGYLARKYRTKAQQSILLIQKMFRGHVARETYVRMVQDSGELDKSVSGVMAQLFDVDGTRSSAAPEEFFRLMQEDFEATRDMLEARKVEGGFLFLGSHLAMSSDGASARLDSAWKAYARSMGAANADKDLKRAKAAQRLSAFYDSAREMSKKLTRWSQDRAGERKYYVSTDGGTGISEAANRGAKDYKGGKALSFVLSPEKAKGSVPRGSSFMKQNSYLSKDMVFPLSSMYARQYWLQNLAVGVVIFPGCEMVSMRLLFDIIAHVAKGEDARKIPVVLFGSRYWKQTIDVNMMSRFGVLSKEDQDLVRVTDSVEETVKLLTAGL